MHIYVTTSMGFWLLVIMYTNQFVHILPVRIIVHYSLTYLNEKYMDKAYKYINWLVYIITKNTWLP